MRGVLKKFSSSFLEFLRTRPFATKQGVSFPLEGGSTHSYPLGVAYPWAWGV